MLGDLRSRLRGWGVLLAGLGGIGAGGGLLLFVWAPELRGFAVATLSVGGVLLALSALASLGTIARAAAGRRGRLSGVSLASVAAAVAAAIAANVVAAALDVSWDLTATRQFELAPQTEQALGGLAGDVRVTGFIVSSDEGELRFEAAAESYLRRFEQVSDGRVSYRFVDPHLEPSVALELGVTETPSLLFESESTGLRASAGSRGVSEQALLTAALRVTRTREHKVYVVRGHGERSINDLRADGSGLGFAAAGLRADGYAVESLDLAASGGVPEDASLLIVAAPVAPFGDDEEAAVTRWLARGGRGLFLADTADETRESMEGLLAEWGLETVAGTLVDPDRSAAGDPRTLVAQRDQYRGETSITEGGAIVGPLGPTFYPGAVAFRVVEGVAARIERGESVPVRYGPLVASSAESWSASGSANEYVEGRDAPGPHTLIVLAQASSALADGLTAEFDPDAISMTLAALGDADFASNRHFNDLDNADLFLNTVNWLLDDVELISTRPKQEVFRPLALTAPEFDFVRYVSWFAAPALLAAAGVVAWWRRR